MKSIFKIAACLSVLLLAYSCKLEEIDTQMTDEEAIANIRLECDALEAYTIQAEKPQAVSFSVTSTTPWSITCSGNPDWLTVSPSSSAESSLAEDIIVKVAVNPGFEDRSTVLTVQGENTEILYKVTITQLRKGRLAVSPATGNFSKNGESKAFTVDANVAWTVTSADPWLTFSKDKGEGTGSPETVQAIAAKNTSIVRQTRVTVTCGDLKEMFDVVQEGEFLEFLPVETTEINRVGEQIELGVKASLDWKVEVDNEAFTATKSGSDKVILSAPFNNQFAPRSVTIILKPVAAEYGDVSNSITLTQDINFKFSGNCEVLEDGSVKISSGSSTRVSTLDDLRFVSIVMTFGEKNFKDKAELWCAVKAAGCNIYNQLTLGGNTRIRTDGSLPDGSSTYLNTTYSITKDELNAMTEYRFDVLPDEVNTAYHYIRFYYNGTLKAEQNYRSIFQADPEAAGPYWFGYYDDASDGTWYVIKTCDITPIAE